LDQEEMMAEDETQTSIGLWADETFGRSTPDARFNRFLKEVIECRALFTPAPRRWWRRRPKLKPEISLQHLADELADIQITLYGVAFCAGINLVQATNIKMSINRSRKWKRHGDGTGQHLCA
jgi:hypothetical protein